MCEKTYVLWQLRLKAELEEGKISEEEADDRLNNFYEKRGGNNLIRYMFE